MKFHEHYETDESKEEEGAWAELSGGGMVRVGSVASATFQKAYAQLEKKYKSELKKKRVPVEIDNKMSAEALAAILFDWQDFEDKDGQPIPYSKEKAFELLLKHHRFRAEVMEIAKDGALFDASISEDQEKNSVTSSAGPSESEKTPTGSSVPPVMPASVSQN